jgi:hypothetical protein
MHSTGSRITVPTAGNYLVTVDVRATNGLDYVDLFRNGALVQRFISASVNFQAVGSIIVVCAAGDYLEIQAHNSAGSTTYATALLGESPKFSVAAQ